jgi:predicted Zn-dependent protease
VTDAANARGLNAAGALSTTARAVAVAHSRGQFAYHADTHARFTCTARSDDSSGWCDRHRHDWRELDVSGLGETAMEKAERSRAPQAVEPGAYTVVLEPSAVNELVAFLAWLGLGAQSLEEGRSFLTDRVGTTITGADVNIADDAFDPRSFGLPFDYEGTPRRRVPLIESGTGLGVVHDRRSARKAGVTSTGHASAPPAVEGALPFDLVLGAGNQTLEQLIAGTERGILVTRFWYNRVVDARRTIVTGMTRDGTFLIEHGRLVRGLRNLRFNENVLELLGRVEAWGRDAEPTLFDFSGNTVVAPALRARDFHFTGVTTF